MPVGQGPSIVFNSVSPSSSFLSSANNSYRKEEATLRSWFTQFASGLEHFYESLWVLFHHDPHTRTLLLNLGLRCLALQTCFNIIAAVSPSNACTTFNRLFFPTVLLYRYLHPQPFDHLFMTTLRSLGAANRSDIVAKSSPSYLTQLRQYIYRTFRAYLAIGTVHWILHRRGIHIAFSFFLGMIAVHQYLRAKGVRYPFMKLAIATVFVRRWPIWALERLVLQQLFMYELLQPYLARVQFKGYEERAWLAIHENELQGFALGAWLICSVPWVGVAAIPAMFSAVAVLLTRSCGVLENLGASSTTGDVIERRSPNVKAVAQGRSESVRGDWDSARMETYVKSRIDFVTTTKTFDSSDHKQYGSAPHSLETGVTVNSHMGQRGHEDGCSTAQQIRRDIASSEERKAQMYREAAMREQEARKVLERSLWNDAQQQQQQLIHQQQQLIHQQKQLQLQQEQVPQNLQEMSSLPVSWPVSSKPSSVSVDHSELSTDSSSLSVANNSTQDMLSTIEPPSLLISKQAVVSSFVPSAPPAQTAHSETTTSTMTLRDLTSYNFSDRKTLETAPSAPEEPLTETTHPLTSTQEQEMQRWLDYYGQRQPSDMSSVHVSQRSDVGTNLSLSRSTGDDHGSNGESQEDEQIFVAQGMDDMFPMRSRKVTAQKNNNASVADDATPAYYGAGRSHSDGSLAHVHSQADGGGSVNYNKPLPTIIHGQQRKKQTQNQQRRSLSTSGIEFHSDELALANSNSSGGGGSIVLSSSKSQGKRPMREGWNRKMGKLPPSGIRKPTSTGLSSVIAQNMMALEEQVDTTFDGWSDTWVQKLKRAATTPVHAAVAHATNNAAAAASAAEKATQAAAEQASSAMTAAAGMLADEKAKLVNVAGEQREKIKFVLTPWSKE
ncbi:hypothetical protein BG004_003259 [Podila humilis]|nr:hypothetical protein BG004_003259 [Podila humilis]